MGGQTFFFTLSNKASRIIIRMGSDKHARRIAMFLSVKHCKKLHSLREIGLKFAVGVSAVSSNSTRTKEKILNNKSIKKQIENIEKNLYEILESVKKKVCPLFLFTEIENCETAKSPVDCSYTLKK